MAFASVGSLGSTNSKTAGGTLSMSPGSDVPVGHLVVVFVAWEGDRGYTDAAGKQDVSLACTDDAGNVYTELQSGLYDVSSSMFLTYVDVALTTGSVITITHRSTTLHAKAMSAWEFSIAANKRFAVFRDALAALEDYGGAAQPGALSTSPGGSDEYLYLHVLANLRPSSDAYTWDSDYTQITSDGTTGGADASNVTLRGGYRIATITTDTVDVSDDTGNSVDIWQGFVAISEVDYDSDFPTFPNFDNFNRADEDPLATPPWSSSASVTPGFGTRLLRVASNKCAYSLVTSTGAGAQFWEDSIPAGDDGEVFVTLDTVGSGSYFAHCFSSGSGQNSTLSGNAVGSVPLADARPDHFDFGDTGFNGDRIERGLITWANRANGDKMGIQMRESGAFLHLWLDLGAGWRWISCYRKQSFIHNGGYFGLNIGDDSAARFDDFGGGTSIRGGPQIYRRVFG